jgi:NIPSNAP
MTVSFWQSKWFAFGAALISFAAGSLITARMVGIDQVQADGKRLFELRIYHDLPGKLPVMEARFREKTSKILARHNLNVVGYWVTADRSESENSFIFMLAHQTREEAKKNWEGVRLDPEFQEIEKAEQTEKTLEKAELLYMRPTDFSSMK